MKKKSPPYAIIAAVVLGVLFLFLGIKWKNGQEQKTQAALAAQADALQKQIEDLKNAKTTTPIVPDQPANMRAVLYATQPIAPGTHISPAFFEVKQTPDNILQDAFTEADKAAVIGLIATRSIEKGDPITPRNTGKTLPVLSQRIVPGMRVIALPVFASDANNAGGFIVDGDRVDLLYTWMTEDNKYILRTEMIMQNVDVLYVPGPTVRSETTEAIAPVAGKGVLISVTFLVTPEQAQALVFISQVKNGRFSMILRSRLDKTELKIKPFLAENYQQGTFKKVQGVIDKSVERVRSLSEQIELEQKKLNSGNTNETPPPPAP